MDTADRDELAFWAAYARFLRWARVRHGLTPQQTTHLWLACCGVAASREVMALLHVSHGAVKGHRAQIFRRLGASDLTRAVTLAWAGFAWAWRGVGVELAPPAAPAGGSEVAPPRNVTPPRPVGESDAPFTGWPGCPRRRAGRTPGPPALGMGRGSGRLGRRQEGRMAHQRFHASCAVGAWERLPGPREAHRMVRAMLRADATRTVAAATYDCDYVLLYGYEPAVDRLHIDAVHVEDVLAVLAERETAARRAARARVPPSG